MPSRAQRPRIPEVSEAQRRARHAWNGGKTGKARPATTGTPPPGMVKVTGSADGAPAHWFCPGRCTVLARTRAELRAIPRRPGGGR
ncbi:hypothetical protein ACIP3A_03685 [Streptomyces tricolor]|uniref:hypothetical protein n=1 Tax=Streptomyces tricolor TaxID=68277 RepID=UPI003806DC4A